MNNYKHIKTDLTHNELTSVSWSQDGRFIASCDLNDVVYLWDAKTFEALHQFHPPEDE